MKRILLATAAALARRRRLGAEPAKVGIILGFTGPLESITPGMAASAELAFKEASDSGKLPGGHHAEPGPRRLDLHRRRRRDHRRRPPVTGENVAAIMGADCSGVTTAIANNVAVPNGVVMVSPSATSPALSTIEDNGYFFRTAPSDARQGEVLAEIVNEKGITDVAVTYTNNDYGKGFADAFAAAFEALGGTVAISAAHEDGKADYSAEVARAAGLRRRLARRARLRRPGRRRHRPGLARHRRLRELLLRRRHVRPEPDRRDRRRDQRQGHRHACPASRARRADRFAAARQGRRHGPDRHLRPRELRRRRADRARDRGRRLRRPHRASATRCWTWPTRRASRSSPASSPRASRSSRPAPTSTMSAPPASS